MQSKLAIGAHNLREKDLSVKKICKNKKFDAINVL